MRVFVNRRAEERGAVAVVVALLAITILIMTGFVVDFGQAYVSKRNLQKAADAGALAGAQALTKYPGTCNNVASNSTALTEAHTAADKYGKLNYPDASRAETKFSVKCDPNLKVLLVDYGLAGTTTSYFGPLAGTSDTITTDREAQAVVDVNPTTRTALRPLALCSAQLPPPQNTDTFVRIDYPKNSVKLPAGCPAKTGGGNWWVLDCPGEHPSDSTELQVLNGCPQGATVVPGQEDELTPGELTVVLEDECDGGPSDTCMGGDTGQIDSAHVADSWKILVQQEEEVIFPVFCAPPQCSDSTIDGTGTNATYPVYKMVAAVVCGYHFSKTEKFHSASGACSGNTVLAGDDPAGNDENYIVIKYIRLRTTGSNEESECALGAECDGGLRRTRLAS